MTEQQWKMDPVKKKRWVEALRSGEYKQTKGTLNMKNTCFCCLGVYADVTDLGTWHGVARQTLTINGTTHQRTCDLPYTIIPQLIQNTLIDMNDNGKSFTEIADYIEKEL